MVESSTMVLQFGACEAIRGTIGSWTVVRWPQNRTALRTPTSAAGAEVKLSMTCAFPNPRPGDCPLKSSFATKSFPFLFLV
ncbi:hypothetical protein ACSBR1_009632 [Camellia fascicularis]